MQTWEYLILTDTQGREGGKLAKTPYFDLCHNDTLFHGESFDQSHAHTAGPDIPTTLASLGDDGWEMCGVVQLEDADQRFAQTRYFFKRPKAG